MIRSCLIVLFSLLVLTGCPLIGSHEEGAEHYVNGLARSLGLDPALSEIPVVTALPRKRDRRLELPDLEMGVVDFLSLYGCELQMVVGERTSVLGRVSHPGARLDFHLRFISAAEDCLPRIESDSRAESIRGAMQTKRESVPEALWNGIWGTGEMAGFVSRSGGTLPGQVDPRALREASERLESLLAMLDALEPGEPPQELARLNRVYEYWNERPLAGQVLRSAEALRARLDDATALLRRHLEQGKLRCGDDPGRYHRLFQSRYLANMSPRLWLVRNEGRGIFRRLHQLLHAPGAEVPESMTPFIRRNLQNGPGSVWDALDQAVKRHVAAWNQLFARCPER